MSGRCEGSRRVKQQLKEVAGQASWRAQGHQRAVLGAQLEGTDDRCRVRGAALWHQFWQGRDPQDVHTEAAGGRSRSAPRTTLQNANGAHPLASVHLMIHRKLGLQGLCWQERGRDQGHLVSPCESAAAIPKTLQAPRSGF